MEFLWILEEFLNLLDFSNSITDKTSILGDFNLHFEQPNSPDVSKFLESIKIFDLMQTVDKPTHRCGYILDWILHRRKDEILQTTHVSHQLTSDHFTIVCDLDLVVPSPPPTFTFRRKLTSIDNCILIQDIKQCLDSRSDVYSRTTRLCFTFIIGQACSYEQL